MEVAELKSMSIGVRLPPMVIGEIDKAAKEEKRTRSDWVRIVLEEALEAKKGGKN